MKMKSSGRLSMRSQQPPRLHSIKFNAGMSKIQHFFDGINQKMALYLKIGVPLRWMRTKETTIFPGKNKLTLFSF